MTDPSATAAEPQAPPARPRNLVGAAMLAVWAGLGWALLSEVGPVGPLVFAFVMLGWVLAVMAHEFSHALTAWFAGDHTVVAKGYLSFDPRRYGDVGTSLVLPLIFLLLGGVGFPGGAVYLRNDLMRSRLWRSAAALAGPAATLVILVVLSAILRIWGMAGAQGPLYPALAVLAFLQAMALILNLLPIPGLDGFGAIRPFLPASLAPHIRRAEGLVMVGLFLVIFFVPGASNALFQGAAGLATALGVPLDAIQWGWSAFHFWRHK